MSNETLHWNEVSGKHKEQVLGLHIFIERDENIKAHKLIGSMEQRNHVAKEEVSSPRVLEEAGMPTCTQEERDVIVANIPSACAQTVTNDHSKAYLSSETEGCNKECLIAVRNETMRPCDVLQITQQWLPQEWNGI